MIYRCTLGPANTRTCVPSRAPGRAESKQGFFDIYSSGEEEEDPEDRGGHVSPRRAAGPSNRSNTSGSTTPAAARHHSERAHTMRCTRTRTQYTPCTQPHIDGTTTTEDIRRLYSQTVLAPDARASTRALVPCKPVTTAPSGATPPRRLTPLHKNGHRVSMLAERETERERGHAILYGAYMRRITGA